MEDINSYPYLPNSPKQLLSETLNAVSHSSPPDRQIIRGLGQHWLTMNINLTVSNVATAALEIHAKLDITT